MSKAFEASTFRREFCKSGFSATVAVLDIRNQDGEQVDERVWNWPRKVEEIREVWAPSRAR